VNLANQEDGSVIRTNFAYLDPGTGSMLVQLLAGGLAGIGVTLKLYWRRVLRVLRIRRDDEPRAGGASARATAPAPEAQPSKVEAGDGSA
jgi:hypothetical protein